jgi:hypothetical protein
MNPSNPLERFLRYSWLLIVSGAICLLVAVIVFARRELFLAHALVAKGTIVDLVEHRGSESDPTFAPVYVFTDAVGKEQKIHSSSSRNPPAYSVGESVKVYYSSDDSTDAVLDGFFDLWGVSAIFGGIGLGHLAIGIVCTRWHKKRSRTDEPPGDLTGAP